MSSLEDFLTEKEENEIVEAIRIAESNTSGEIRVHIENSCETDVFNHAKEVFHYLKMDNTKLQNGVLIYVAVQKREFIICGDKGINDIVVENFWDSTRDKIAAQFRLKNYKQGLIDGIQEVGKELSTHFPWIHGDSDELDNNISKN